MAACVDALEESECQKMEEDGEALNEQRKSKDSLTDLETSRDTHLSKVDKTCDAHALKKDDSGITLDGFMSCKTDETEQDGSKSPSVSLRDATSDADMNDTDWLNDSAVPSSSLSESGADTKSEGSPPCRKAADLVNGGATTSSSAIGSDLPEDVDMTGGSATVEVEGGEAMCVDKDELLALDTEIERDKPLLVDSGQVHVGTVTSDTTDCSLGSPGSKRITNDDDDSPRPKRPTPDRSPDAVDREGMENGAFGASDEASHSQDLPELNLASDEDEDDDDDDDDDSTIRRRRNRRVKLPRRLFGRVVSSSDESDTSEDEDNDNDRNTEEDDKETDDEDSKSVSEILNKQKPKPNWFAVPELRRREYGHTSHQSTSCFRERVQGSLQMAQRLIMVESMKGHEGCVNALSFNRIGTLLASGSDDLNIVLWNWQRARPSLIYDSGHRSNVFQAKFMPFSGDCHVISCARDGQVRLAELSLTGVCKATRKLAQHRGAAHKLALELDSPNVFLSCGEDALTYLFDLREERPHKLVTTKENDKKVPLYSIHSNPCDSRQFCVGGRDHYIRVYDKRKINEGVDAGVLKKFCPDHLVNSEVKANVTCACYNYNGTEILGSYNDEDIYLFDNTQSDGANFIHKYTGHRNNATVKGVNFYGPKSEFIVSGSDCGHVYFWDKETEAIINFQEGDEAGVINVLEPHPTLPVLATSGLDHDVKLWMPSQACPVMDMERLKKTLKKNQRERSLDRQVSEPEMIGGPMLWFIMHHFRNSARRRMREEGQVLSSSDDDDPDDSHSGDSDTNEMQCAQS